ncbi:ABC-type transport system involved in multi-copper enzyme maturation, permease component [Geodermatophilus telluris]|uniref:ABC-type transport system involved in multi-copper enzyme maturation, permease component n=1 Tax=Geodermatophilus telluris TaxID=1190417 RepID=A0A1G6PML4_9ACTN|nr:ABC transporter permease subunit [Geodermatophilus telluris]SDC81502.1 ABC-type transport system involved in multi-copper enzyme maturation, permease component [Geodermatophilus telluris]
MSTDTLHPRSARVAPAWRPAGGGVRGLLVGQWLALRSLRTTWWVLGGASVAMVLLGLLFTSTSESGGPGGRGGPPGLDLADPVALSLGGYNLAALATGVLGVLLVTGEYTSGAVRVTFAAVPQRWPVLLGRAAVLAAVALATTTAAAVAAFLVGQAALGDAGVSLADDGVARAVLGAGLYVTAIGLLGSALGWLLRSTGGAIGTLFGIVFLLPVLGGLLPSSWGPDVVRWLPGQAGSSVLQRVTTADEFAPWTGYAVLCGYLVLLFAAAVVTVRRRDA